MNTSAASAHQLLEGLKAGQIVNAGLARLRFCYLPPLSRRRLVSLDLLRPNDLVGRDMGAASRPDAGMKH